jgi:hypothetical protein
MPTELLTSMLRILYNLSHQDTAGVDLHIRISGFLEFAEVLY